MNTEELLLSTSEKPNTFSINLWDSKTKNSIFSYQSDNCVNRHLISLIGNDYIVGGNTKNTKLNLWQLNRKEPIKKYRWILPEIPSCLCISPDSNFLSVGIKTDLYIWQLGTGRLLSIQRKNYQNISVLKFSTCGHFLIVAGQDGILNTYRFENLISLNKTRCRKMGETEALYTRNDHDLPITDVHVGAFGSKSRFATCSLDQTVKIYELLTGKLLLNIVYENPVHSIICNSAGLNLYVGCSNGVLQEFKLSDPPRELNKYVSLKEDDEPLIFKGHTENIQCLSLNLLGNILASGDITGLIIIWDVFSKQIMNKIQQNTSITNLTFIFNHQNILSHNYDFVTSLKNLEMNLDISDTNVGVDIIQDIEIEDPSDNSVQEQIILKEEFAEKNFYLQAHVQDLLEIVNKLHSNQNK